ncbi:Phosphotransferase enzyme family protein [Lentzea waywayandensis]|uniref:Phosphotransferase enzyme family protein n=1 Tax=Lentzea waywayandensis TaxID=84724 RepID=A0A1I6FJ74_9PSEU|nr:phosphotransferase [Lentzea waywayandensis]SFR30001.1 Phosphotransferase enzyme family protein [Lentzea waywayandensis]
MDARAIATSALGRDPGPLAPVSSRSHHVYIGADVVVKLIAANDHERLDREIALAPHLPPGLTAPLLASGRRRDVRYACYTRVPGAAPGMGLPDTGERAALDLARQAIERLEALHAWTPPEPARRVLAEVPDHGGFTSRHELIARTEKLEGVVPPNTLDGLKAIAARAPEHARNTVPVHADCHWGNWLANGTELTALLDFEWARFGDPLDDWFFLARFSGLHMHAVLDVISDATEVPLNVLRVECEAREASHLIADLPFDPAGVLKLLEQLVAGIWWPQ